MNILHARLIGKDSASVCFRLRKLLSSELLSYLAERIFWKLSARLNVVGVIRLRVEFLRVNLCANYARRSVEDGFAKVSPRNSCLRRHALPALGRSQNRHGH